MRCHQNRINLKSAALRQMLPAGSSSFLPNDRPNTHSHTHTRGGIDPRGGCAVLCLASHLQCICITVSAPVKVNTTSSLWPNRYFCLFCLDTLKLPLKPTERSPVCQIYSQIFTYSQIINAQWRSWGICCPTGCSLIFVKVWNHVGFRGRGCLCHKWNSYLTFKCKIRACFTPRVWRVLAKPAWVLEARVFGGQRGWCFLFFFLFVLQTLT